MFGKRSALKIQSVTNCRELRHDVVESSREVVLPSRIGSARQPIIRSVGHGRRCAGSGI
jgi:hypothetical protein